MKTILKSVGVYVIGALLYGLMLFMTVLTSGMSPYVTIATYLLAPLVIIVYITITSLFLIEELVGEEQIDIHMDELVKKMGTTVLLTFIIGVIVQYIMVANTGIMNKDPIETSIFLINLAYIIPYGLLANTLYKELFDKLELEKSVLSEYVAITMLSILSILLLMSLTRWAVISSIIMYTVVVFITLHLKENEKGLTGGNDLEYNEEELVD